MLARFLQGAAKRGQLRYVGGNASGVANGSGFSVSLTALTGGVGSSAQAGDIVIAAYATGSTANVTLSITDGTNAYNLIGSELYTNGTSVDTNLRVGYKVLDGADSLVQFPGTARASDGSAAVVHVWRGVDPSTPLDVAAATATGAGTGRPNPPSITPATAGAKIIVVGAAAMASAAAFTVSYLSGLVQQQTIETYDSSVAMGYVDWTSGAYDPEQFSGGTTGAGDSWAAVTIALRPA